jgi:hypothetical protein
MSNEETIVEVTPETEVEDTTELHSEVDSTDWKAEARKWENRAKASKADGEDAAKWRDYEGSQKTEHEKLAEKLASAEEVATQASTKLLRYEVASEKGIPSEAVELLTGSSRDELEAAADKLLRLIASQSKTQLTKPDYNSGKAAGHGSSTADQFAAALNDII